ncbi:hypothetical protein [Halarcobacter anaerophilus]|jgi:hypothetical protein|uniref:Uncharacterized protein n=1 Tax=Halarcobacter anaerophilus TaxID=877500 RepID=A0A4Q0XUY1_9BACT|nr:hypothetical protein [Halarcobacter anaerophilus]QDF28221.1 hypothetical protein AANAER_0727 [Halarcobacter anaerophilus]RXJ61377.1 hypothetical protein CRV06_13920 [Halarcobacter anaerophilus]
MDLILVSKTAIIEKIFTLVCAKMNINLTVQDSLDFDKNVDIIVIDEEFVNEEFNTLKTYTKKLAAIVSEELPFDKSRDFIVNRPFLPNVLENLLKEQIEFIKDDEKSQKKRATEDFNEEEIISNYVESLAEDVAMDIEEDNDESIVTVASLNKGGVLDNNELTKISDILHDDEIHDKVSTGVDENDWKDINTIIDDALNEVKEYEFDLKDKKEGPSKLILNNYSINELKPFLQKFDQSVIDRLSNGEDVDVTLSLRVNK